MKLLLICLLFIQASSAHKASNAGAQKTAQKKPVAKVVQKSTVVAPSNEIHYYKGGGKSVVITPWKDAKRQVLLYNRKGVQTYAFEEVRQSYQVSATITYNADGSVSVVHVHTNPGASMYWYEDDYRFKGENQPDSHQSQQMPQSSVEMPKIELWDSVKNDWIHEQQPGGRYLIGN